jgi:hypothetical protein
MQKENPKLKLMFPMHNRVIFNVKSSLLTLIKKFTKTNNNDNNNNLNSSSSPKSNPNLNLGASCAIKLLSSLVKTIKQKEQKT